MTGALIYKDRRNALWDKCKACSEFVFKQTLKRNLYICPFCSAYFPMPAESRLDYLLDPDSRTDLDPVSIPQPLLKSLGLSDLVVQTKLHNLSSQSSRVGEGRILDQPAIVAIIHPYDAPQRAHFVALLIATRYAAQAMLPLVTIYPNDGGPRLRRHSDIVVESALSFAETTYLAIEMESLSQAGLPQITVMTETHIGGTLSTRFPLGDFVLAEWSQSCIPQKGKPANKAHDPSQTLPDSQRDMFIDLYVERNDLQAILGKLLRFFTQGERR